MDDLLSEFLTESAESLEAIDAALAAFGREPNRTALLDDIFRRIHTIKGTCGFLELPRLEALTHAAETILDAYRDGAPVTPEGVSLVHEAVDRIRDVLRELAPAGAEPASAPHAVRVPVDTIDRLTAAVETLAPLRDELHGMAGRFGGAFRGPLTRLSTVTNELETAVTEARTQPVGDAWRTVPRMVRDLAKVLGKRIDLVTAGGDITLDRSVVDQIKDSLAHLVRNAADHGLEPPAARRAAGKPETGVLTISVTRDADQVMIEVRDDGTGLDVDKIAAKAVEKGLATPHEIARMTERQIQDLIFMPGVSTAAEVAHISGRGVGMDVVRANVARIGGTVEVTSVAGQGTSITLTVPATLDATAMIDVQHFVAGETAQRPHVLLVAGGAFVRDLLTSALSAAGYGVTATACARDTTVLKAQGAPYDAIVSDIDGPDGIGWLTGLRGDAAWAGTSVVAISSKRSADTAEQARRAGFHDVVGKLDRPRLIECLEACAAPMDSTHMEAAA